jgi:hypothetical protein
MLEQPRAACQSPGRYAQISLWLTTPRIRGPRLASLSSQGSSSSVQRGAALDVFVRDLVPDMRL